ncbi:ABC transporter ATP-binding protein [Phreatobacter cathodiphilus]|uniref:ABC transporter ATP-binding protein n=1 Tax=Phreatobacter cathodiphilus TaxID=1868589 RepID=A0A2S0N6H2_9HYPH|nr:ABC transporter ATP-binding protein [Phreatobacter cathodiphilus]AVO43740.1 ABC transporter ATP-binding protein [Phreatobacter cathodiphilus]
MQPLIELHGVSKSFGGLRAVDGLTATIRRGEVVGLVGPNGSGKTTALNLITGNLTADSGAIVFEGRNIEREAAHRITRAGIARTFQLVRVMPTMTLAENVAVGAMFGARPCGPSEAEERALPLLVRVGLAPRAGERAQSLTYIDQKRLELARALAAQPNLLLLDEWLAGLNPTELKEGIALIASLARDGLTIVMVEHVMDAIRALCTRCIVMNAGAKIAEGTPAEALADPGVVKAYLGDDDDA